MLCFLPFLSLSYNVSLFGYHGINTVQVQEIDGYEVLEVLKHKPSGIKNIRDAGYSSPKIANDNDYGWPGHTMKATKAQISSELEKMKAQFCKASSDLTQGQLYYHPAGIKQFIQNDTYIAEIQRADRIKLRMFINDRYDIYHSTTLYAMPGELITFEIPEFAVGKLNLVLNRQAPSNGDLTQRYPNLQCSFTLNAKKVTFGYPLGGYMDIKCWIDTFPLHSVEINITGGIRIPYFRYGAESDQDWEEETRNYVAPLTFYDTGNVKCIFPSTFSRNQIRMSDAGAFWRTVGRVMYSVNEVTNYDRRKDGRIKTAMWFNFDSYVPAGAAVAFVGANFIQAPFSWSTAMINYEGAKWGCWGNVHEYGHHFQSGWGISGTGETTNNVINFITYAMLTEIDATRQITLGGASFNAANGWAYITHEFGNMDATKDYAGPFFWYGNNAYFFGLDAWRKCLRAHTHQIYYKRSDYGTYTSEFLMHCAKFFHRDLRAYFKTFEFPEASQISDRCNNELSQMKLKEFHPVTMIWCSGYQLEDNYSFTTHKPFRIPARSVYYFDFTKNIKSRAKMHAFEFDDISKAEYGELKKLTTGKYKYTPPDNTSMIDMFNVTLKDKVNGEKTICIITLEQRFKGCRMNYMSLKSYGATKTTTPKEAYKIYNKQLETELPTSLIGWGMVVNNYGSDKAAVPWICVTEGVFVPENSTKYRFIFQHDEGMLFYITDSTLSGDPDSDEKYLYYSSDKSEAANAKQDTKSISLKEGTKYNFRFIVYNTDNAGSGQVKYSMDGSSEFKNVDGNRVWFPGCGPDDVDHIFKPKLENDPTLGHYYDTVHREYATDKFTVKSAPKPDDSSISMDKILFDKDIKQNALCTVSDFPVTYKVDFGSDIIIDRVLATSMEGKPMDSTADIKCDGTKVGTFNLTTKDNKMFFDNTYKCRTLELIVNDNKNGKYVSINEIEPHLDVISNSRQIIPATHIDIELSSEKKCKIVKNGLYYNGKGLQLDKGCKLTFNVKLNDTGDSIGVLGDRTIYGGVFEFSVGGDYRGTVDTREILNSEKQFLPGYSIYQQPLVGVRGLKNGTDYEVQIKVTEGSVRIAGFLADMTLHEVFENYDDRNAYYRSARFIIPMIIASIFIALVLVIIVAIIVLKCKKAGAEVFT